MFGDICAPCAIETSPSPLRPLTMLISGVAAVAAAAAASVTRSRLLLAAISPMGSEPAVRAAHSHTFSSPGPGGPQRTNWNRSGYIEIIQPFLGMLLEAERALMNEPRVSASGNGHAVLRLNRQFAYKKSIVR